MYALAQLLGQEIVKFLVQALLDGVGARDDVLQAHVLGVDATILQQGSHEQTRQLLSRADDAVLCLWGDLVDDLGSAQEAGQMAALGLDVDGELLETLGGADQGGAGEDVAVPDRVDDVQVDFGAGLQGFLCGTEESG